jgi:hypothetical protein
MDPKRLYESPVTDVNARGPEGVFSSAQVDQLVAVLAEIVGGQRREGTGGAPRRDRTRFLRRPFPAFRIGYGLASGGSTVPLNRAAVSDQ